MATKNDIFIDSNYFVALYNPKDTLHTKATEITRRLNETGRFIVSNYVMLEVLTVLSQKLGRKAAVNSWNNILQSNYVEIVHITKELNDMSWQIFQSTQSKNISFVDCSIIAAMQYSGIKQILTFDITDFEQLRKQFSFRIFQL